MSLTQEQVQDLRVLALAATPGPWRWTGYRKHEYALATVHWGRRWVMRFVRLGMQGAQPQFQTYEKREGDDPFRWSGIMDKADDLAVQEVPYRGQIIGIDNPDARYIAAVDPTTILSLLDMLKEAEDRWEDFQESARSRD